MPQGTATGTTATAAAGTAAAAHPATAGQGHPPASPPSAQAQHQPHEEEEKWLGKTKMQWIWIGIAVAVTAILLYVGYYWLNRETGLGYHLDRPHGVECSEQSRLVRELKAKYDLEAKTAQNGYSGPSGHWDSTRYTTELNAAMARFKASQASLNAQYGCNVDLGNLLVQPDPSNPVDKNIMPICLLIAALFILGLGGALGKLKTSGQSHGAGH